MTELQFSQETYNNIQSSIKQAQALKLEKATIIVDSNQYDPVQEYLRQDLNCRIESAVRSGSFFYITVSGGVLIN
jgi:hypothetical protein